jgi:hypothetical protein
MMLTVEINKTLRSENSSLIEILKRTVAHEKNHPKDSHFLSWKWIYVRPSPVKLIKKMREEQSISLIMKSFKTIKRG